MARASSNYIAIDLGASNGRLVLGRLQNHKIELSELHRFVNEPINLSGNFHWDVLRLWKEIKIGLKKYAQEVPEPLSGISVDTWGVDFGLLDENGELLGNPFFYRDKRTAGMRELVNKLVLKQEVYAITGIQYMDINSLYQVYSLLVNNSPQLKIAEKMLLMPDLFIYWLSGKQYAEYTIASSTQMLDAKTKDWAYPILKKLGIPSQILPKVIMPATVVGNILPELAKELGMEDSIPIIATAGHDTADAVAAIPKLNAKSIYISSGTWSLVGIEAKQPITDQEMMKLDFTNEGGVADTIRLLKNVAGLWLLQESRRQWQREGKDYSWQELIELAEQAEAFKSLVDPDEHSFSKPGNTPARIRDFCNRTKQAVPNTVAEVVRTCLESLALRYRWVIESLEEKLERKFETIHIVGGGSQNKMLNQFTANACNKTVFSGPIEATAFGNVMLQAIATRRIKDVTEGRKIVANSVDLESFEPQNTSKWDLAYLDFKKLLDDGN